MPDTKTVMFNIIAKDNTSKTFDKVGKEMDQTSGRTSKLRGHFGSLAKMAATGLGIGIATRALVGMTKAAAEDQSAQSKLAQTLTTAAHATSGQRAETERWITAQGKAFGVTDDELRPALGRLAAATHDVGKSQSLARLAMDVSAGSGKSLEQVTTALAKAQNGSVGGLSRLGVATKDAQGHTKSLDDITKDLANTYQGAAAKAADTTAGKQKILQAQYGELQEQIGAKLLPVMSKLADWGLKTVDWMSKNGQVAGPLVAIIASLVAGLWLFAKGQAAVNFVMEANPIGLVVVALVALAAGLVYAYKHSETFRNTVNGAFSAIKTGAGLMWGALKGYFKFIVDMWLNVAGAIVHGAASAFGWVPKLGPKLKAAAANFDTFKAQVNAALDGTKDKKKITVSTPGAKEAINSLSTIFNLVSKVGDNLAVQVGTPKSSKAHRALGGRVFAGQPFIAGEGGTETVVPMVDGMVTAHRQGVGGQGQQPIIIQVSGALDPNAVAKQIHSILLKYKRTNGGMALELA